MTGKLALTLLGTLALAFSAPGQSRFQVTPDGLSAGTTAEITFADPGLAGRTILVEIDNGSVLNPSYQYVTIGLDANGNGTGSWDVPESGWKQANFSAPESKTVSMRIYRPKPIAE